MRWIDLHVHSTASDGTTDPEMLPQAVMRQVKEEGKKYDEFWLALTDHDTVAGVKRLKLAARDYPNFHVVPGVEISCNYKEKEIHMLGLYIDEDNEELVQKLEYYREDRKRRNTRILQRFSDIGIEIPEEALKVAEGETPGRPHIARYLMEQGITSSVKEGFDRFLKEGGLCYVDREKPTPEEGIRMIQNAGGMAVLAHPMQYRHLDRTELEELVRSLKEAGLEGIETYYTEFTAEETVFVEDLSRKYGLFTSGGSDYHGQNKPDYHLGSGMGSLTDTMELVFGSMKEVLR